MNDEVSCDDICKFEIGTTKNHYKDIHNDILEKHQKKSPKGVFLALKVPEGHEPEFSRVQQYYFYVRNNILHILAKFHKDLMNG